MKEKNVIKRDIREFKELKAHRENQELKHKEILITLVLAVLLLCFLFACGGEPSGSRQSENAELIQKIGKYRGSLVLSAELAIRLDAEDLHEGYAELAVDGKLPTVQREMVLDVAEDLEQGISNLTGNVTFADALGENAAETAFAEEGESFYLLEDGEWGSAKSENVFLGFFRDAFLSIPDGKGKAVSLDGKDCLLYEKVLKSGDPLFGELAQLSNLPGDVSVPVKLWMEKESGRPYRLEADAVGLGDALLGKAFAESWVDGAWFTLKNCLLTFNWTDFDSEEVSITLPSDASPDVTIPDSLLPALLYAGSKGMLERRNENIEVLDQLLEENWEEILPEGDASLPPEDDVEEFSDPDDSLWMNQGENPGWLSLSMENVGAVGLTVPESYRMSGYDESFAELISVTTDGKERIVDYYLEEGVSASQIEKDVCSPEGYSEALGYSEAELGIVQGVTINEIFWQWRGAVYKLDNGDGTVVCCRNVSAWSARGNGVFRVEISVPCGSIDEARSLDSESLIWEFLSLAVPM